VNILEEISLVYGILKSNIIHEVFEFIIINYSNRSWVRIFRQLCEPEYMTCICYTPRRIMITYHNYKVEYAWSCKMSSIEAKTCKNG